MKTILRLAILFLFAAALRAQTRPTAGLAPPADVQKKVEQYLRDMFAWGPAYQVEVGKPSASPVRGLYDLPVKVTYQGTADTGDVYLSEDGHYLVRGELDNLFARPFTSVLAHLHPGGNPAVGPADARVTVVFFSDFECPHCRELYEILKRIRPRYPQVRFVFKDFPVVQIHPWAMTAAIAARCAYMQNPAAFWKLHDDIFENQDQITPDDAWDKMLDFARQSGLDPSVFRQCMVSSDATAAVEANIADGKAVGVTSTPTIFVDGRTILGSDEELLERFLQYDLGREVARRASRATESR
jgi:protein-disulfide isomerase